jgi:hypothetical protein
MQQPRVHADRDDRNQQRKREEDGKGDDHVGVAAFQNRRESQGCTQNKIVRASLNELCAITCSASGEAYNRL